MSAAATHRKDLMNALRANAHRHDLWSVWSDFVAMAAIALSNTVDLRQRDEREAEYLRIVGRYRADEVERFAHVMFGWSQRLQRRHQPDEEHPIPITTEPTAAREPVQFGLFEEQRAA